MPKASPSKERNRFRKNVHLHISIGEAAPLIIVAALVTAWLSSVFVDLCLSYQKGTLSQSLDDLVKQGPTFLLGLLTKIVGDALFGGGSEPEPVPVKTPDNQPLEIIPVPSPKEDEIANDDARESGEDINPNDYLGESETSRPSGPKPLKNPSKTTYKRSNDNNE